VRSAFRREQTADDVLTERVRSALGRAVSHSGAIAAECEDGRIVLRGDVLESEHQALLQTVRNVPGVMDVRDELAVHQSAEHISSLQGHPRERNELVRQRWTPAARMIAGVGGGALMLYAVRQRGLMSFLTLATGSALVLRSTTNMPIRRIVGAARGPRMIDIHKTINVQAPVELVYSLLEDQQNFPAFMRNVREVTMYSDGRSHWVVAGPAGMAVEFDSETTERKPNELLAWRTVPNSVVEHQGRIRFRPTNDNCTQLEILMSYNPPAGALGHALAKLFGADPKSELDQDLMRMKTFLESGKPPHDAAAATGAGRVSASQPGATPGL
jgi:uncharacterized membrane protein